MSKFLDPLYLLALAFLGVRHRSAADGTKVLPAWRDPLRCMCLVAMIPLIWALYWTGSRGAEVALLVIVFLYFSFEVRHWGAILAVTGVGGLGMILFWPRILRLFSQAGHGLLSERFLLSKAALLMIRDHFFLGVGLDSFNTLYRPAAPNSYALKALDGQPFPADYNPDLSHPHNFLLDFWISTGLLGEVALFWLLGAFATLLVRVYRLCAFPLGQGRVLQRLLLGIAGSIIVSMVHGMVDNFYFVPDLAMMFWFFMSMVLLIQRIAQQEQATLQYQRKAGSSPDNASEVPAPVGLARRISPAQNPASPPFPGSA